MIPTTGVPERSLRQRLEALERANDIRVKRAEFKRQLRTDRTRARERTAEALFGPAAELRTMRIYDLLLSTPTVGKVKANRILNRTRVSPSRTLGGLTERQRRELVRQLDGIGG